MQIEKEMKEVFDFYSLDSGDNKKETITRTQIESIIEKIGIDVDRQAMRKWIGSDISDKVDYPSFLNLFTNEIYEGSFLIHL